MGFRFSSGLNSVSLDSNARSAGPSLEPLLGALQRTDGRLLTRGGRPPPLSLLLLFLRAPQARTEHKQASGGGPWCGRVGPYEASAQMSIAEGVALGLPPHELVRCANEPRSVG